MHENGSQDKILLEIRFIVTTSDEKKLGDHLKQFWITKTECKCPKPELQCISVFWVLARKGNRALIGKATEGLVGSEGGYL